MFYITAKHVVEKEERFTQSKKRVFRIINYIFDSKVKLL